MDRQSSGVLVCIGRVLGCWCALAHRASCGVGAWQLINKFLAFLVIMFALASVLYHRSIILVIMFVLA